MWQRLPLKSQQRSGAVVSSSQRREVRTLWSVSNIPITQGQLNGFWSCSACSAAVPGGGVRCHYAPMQTDCCGRGCGCDHSAGGASGTPSSSSSSSSSSKSPRWLVPRELLTAALATSLCCTASASHAVEGAATADAAATTGNAASAVLMGGSGVDVTAAELVAAGVTSAIPPGYVPSPVDPGWEIWLGFVAGVVPFMIGAYEFGKRIIIQLRCEECGGRGLVPSAGPGRDKYLRKCPQCGGFFPWISWKMFLSSTAAPGNGGPLQQPRGQSSVFYSVPEKPDTSKQAEALARSQATIDVLQKRATGSQQQQQQPQEQEQGPGGGDSVSGPTAAVAQSGGAAQKHPSEAHASSGITLP